MQAYSLYSAKICHLVLTMRQLDSASGATIYQACGVTIFIAIGNLSQIVILFSPPFLLFCYVEDLTLLRADSLHLLHQDGSYECY